MKRILKISVSTDSSFTGPCKRYPFMMQEVTVCTGVYI